MADGTSAARRTAHALLLQTAAVAVGAGLLALASGIPPAAAAYRPAALAALFGALHFGLGSLPGRARARGDAWRPRGLLLLGPGVAGGAALQVVPFLVADAGALAGRWDSAGALASLGAAAVAGTALAVLWEELWFRNPVLDRVPAGRPRLLFAACNGALFAALHLLNPRFVLAVDGPEILAAGTVLTMAYYAGGNFYLPLGLHLGNNLAGRALDGALGPGGRESLGEGASTGIRVALLALGAAVAAFVLARRERRGERG